MRFQSKTENEIAAENLMGDGRYPFGVIVAKDDVSKRSGNDMISLKLKVFDDDNREHHVYDYLMESMAFKLRHFCYAVGLSDKYEAGTLTAADCLGREGWCEIRTDSKDPNYAPKNVVKDYFTSDGKNESGAKPEPNPKREPAKPKPSPEKEPEPDDSVPF